MRVLVLGAGASFHAGYPLASNLLTEVEKHVNCSPMVNIRNDWTQWVGFRDSCPDYLQLVVRNKNPEIVFTLPTLLQVAIDVEDPFQLQQALNKAQTSGVDEQVERLQEYHTSHGRNFLVEARYGLFGLQRTLNWYFLEHHIKDGQNTSRRDPLKILFSRLQPGDVIITLNWDTTAERTLAEMKKWSPIDGYGFQKDLCIRSPDGQDIHVPDQISSSAVTVLKLHGSFGWYTDGDSVSFENTNYLNEFGYNHEGPSVILTDPEYSYSSDITQLLVTPSFIKNLTHPILVRIWEAAHSALAQADAVDVWGYSLPEADGAARALLLGLKARLAGKGKITVHDPSNATRERWLRLLGNQIDTKDERVGPPCSTEIT